MDKFEKSLIGRPNTVKANISIYRNQIKPYLTQFEAYDEVMVRHLIKEWLDKGLKPNTIKSCISVLKVFIRHHTGRNIDCTQFVRTISKMDQDREVSTWTKDEAKKILRKAEQSDPDMYKLLLLAFSTGARKGELLGLRWSDIDLVGGKIKIQRSFDGPTKTGKARTVPMTKAVADLFLNGYIVGADDNRKIFNITNPNRRLRSLCRVANVPVMSFHSTRHFFATEALRADRSPREVAHILGHASVSTTLDTYWSLSKQGLDVGFLDFLEDNDE